MRKSFKTAFAETVGAALRLASSYETGAEPSARRVPNSDKERLTSIKSFATKFTVPADSCVAYFIYIFELTKHKYEKSWDGLQ